MVAGNVTKIELLAVAVAYEPGSGRISQYCADEDIYAECVAYCERPYDTTGHNLIRPSYLILTTVRIPNPGNESLRGQDYGVLIHISTLKWHHPLHRLLALETYNEASYVRTGR
jgi:hypothetical protein